MSNLALKVESFPLTFEQALLKASMPADVARNFSHITLPFELMPHQQENLHCGLSWNRFGLFDDMRTGKTIVMQLLAIFYRAYGLRTVLLMPPILFDQFISTFNEIKGHGLTVKALIGPAKAKEKLLTDWALGASEPPDLLLMSKELFSGPHGKAAKGRAKTVEYVKRRFQCLSWDECHIGLQSEESIIFKTVDKFMTVPDARLVLSTGTPSTNELLSTYPIIKLKSPGLYQSRRHFDALHVCFREIMINVPPSVRNPAGKRRVRVVDHYTNTEVLSKNLYHQAHRVTRSEVLDINQPNIQIVPIKLDPSHLKFYKTVVKERLVELDGEDGEGEMIDLRKEQALRQFALRVITSPEFGGAGSKVKQNNVISGLQALFDSSNISSNKIIVFANFNNSVEYLASQFAKYNPAKIYGPNGSDRNRAEAERFKTSESCKLAIINPQAGGVGFTFGDVSQTAIFAEPVSTPGMFEQAASRVLLKGQTQPVAVYILEVLETLSPKAIEHMIKKGQEVQEVVKDRAALLLELFPSK